MAAPQHSFVAVTNAVRRPPAESGWALRRNHGGECGLTAVGARKGTKRAREEPMKRTLLVSVAAIALAIGANTAYSQGSRQGGGGAGGAAGGTSSPSASPSGGASSPSAAQPGASGSMSEPKQKGAQEQTTPRGSTTQREEKGGREPSKQQTQGTGQTGTK